MGIKKKVYEDYLKNSRLPDYQRVLQTAKEHGYKMVGVLDFYELIASGKTLDIKLLVNRHDIDTSPRVASKFFRIEKDVYGKSGTATYYFRETTIDIKLIEEINSYGYESGYHYEELATYEKKHKTKNKESVVKSLPEVREVFLRNLTNFRRRTGSKSLSVSSHGDFINNMYRMSNTTILEDLRTRAEANIKVEAYDQSIMSYIDERYADQVLLESFSDTVIESIKRNCKHIMILTHPRNWRVDYMSNTKENIRRLYQGIKYRI